MLPISGFILICLLFSAAYFIGLLTFITDYEENKCEMTYMFEYPQFVRIHNKIDALQEKYALYAYSEGHSTERVRQMYFTGIPVLFVPGNAGSHKQVRSFASVALRKALDDRPGFHFDFFTIDLNNELSGLNGALLGEQTQYVNLSITRILELYRSSKYAPKSVVLIGHSMGGVIARTLLASLPSNSELLPLVITLGTPHARPPVISDVYMMDFYKKLQHNVSYPETSTIVAISGGYNDFLVSPYISYARHFKNLHVVTTSSPKVWLPVDHLCILWCKQLVLAVTRSLFDSVKMETKQISLNSSYHRQVFRHHLAKHSGTNVRQASRYNLPVMLDKSSSKWIENLQSHYTISLVNGTKTVEYHMIRLLNEPTHEWLTILAINLEVTDWVFACAAVHMQGQTRICSEAKHLSHLSEIAPSIKYKRRTLELNLHELKRNSPEITHVVARVLPTREPVFLHVDIHGAKEQKLEVNIPRWWSFGLQPIIPQTPQKIVQYELTFPHLQHIIQSYRLYVQPLKCSNANHHATASLKVPWADHDVHQFFTQTEKDPLHIRLFTSRPFGLNASSLVKLTLDPVCTYSVSIKSSFTGMLSQMARTYSTLLIANITAVILLVFRNQLKSIETTGSCSLFFYAIKYGVKPYYILTLVKLASKGLSWKGLSPLLPAPDWQLIADEGIDFFVLPLLLYICGVGIVWLIAAGVAVSLILFESTFHKIASTFLARTITGAIKLSDWLIAGLHKLPCVAATALIFLSFSTCGALALCLGSAFYFLKLTQMSQDYIESLVMKILKYFGSKFKKLIFQKRPENTISARKKSNATDLNDRALQRTEEVVHQEGETQNCDKQDGDKQDADILSSDETDSADENTAESDETNDQNSREGELNVLENEGSQENENKERQEKMQLNVKNKEEPQNSDPNTAVDESDDNAVFFHFSIFLLWCLVTLLNVPYLLTWAHNFKYSSRLQPDPSFLPGIVLSFCALPLWQLDFPKTNICLYDHVGHVLNILAGISLIYAPISVYRLVYIITVAIAIITLHQLFAPRRSALEESIVEEGDDASADKTTFSKVKRKWE